jgi:hypothetical protein
MRPGQTALILLLAATGGVCATGCGPPQPYVRYDGDHFGRTPKPVDDMEVLRAGPPAAPARYQDLGTVVVTCPSQMAQTFGGATSVGGCNYHWAVRRACERAAEAGADGIHSIDSASSASGATVSLRASVFVRLPNRVTVAAPAPPQPRKAEPTVQERLRQLEELKKEELITPDEYQKKRAEILQEI